MSSMDVVTPPASSLSTNSIDTVIRTALSWVGKGKYVYGGTGDPSQGVDCSSFVQWLFGQNGVQLGRDTGAQRAQSDMSTVNGGLANAKPGDLLYFGDATGPNAHVGIYLGGGKMVSAENPQAGIQIADISNGAFGSESLNMVRRSSLGASTTDYSSSQPTDTNVPNGGTIGGSGGGTGGAGGSTGDFPLYDPTKYNAPSYLEALWIKQNDASDLWMLQTPELAKILDYVSQNQVTNQNVINSLVAQTDWYKTHSDAQRAWIQQYASDPAAAAKEIGSSDPTNPNYGGAELQVQQAAGQMGAQLTPDQMNKLAIDSKFYAWTPQELQSAIAAYLPGGAQAQNVNPNPLSQTGQAGATADQLQAAADNMFVKVSPQLVNGYVQRIQSGADTMQGFQAYLEQQALSQYPGFAQQIERGMTMQQATDGYRQSIATTLGLDPNSVSLTDPKYSRFLNQTGADPKTGEVTSGGPMPLWQVQQTLMSDPSFGYQFTPDARNKAATWSQTIANMFGQSTGGQSAV